MRPGRPARNLSACLLGAALCGAPQVSAQTGRIWIDGGVSAVVPFGEDFQNLDPGYGLEAGLSVGATDAFSIGAGYIRTRRSYSSGDALETSGAYVEPRVSFQVGRGASSLYLAARGSYSRVRVDRLNSPTTPATGQTVGIGAGVVLRPSPRFGLDLGLRTALESDGTVGLVNGPKDVGNGFNLVGRIGFSIAVTD